MIGGFAVVAYPAKYGNSGVMTFIVNQDGKVYQADLGPETKAKAEGMQRFESGQGLVRRRCQVITIDQIEILR